jgi:hypothetical protein
MESNCGLTSLVSSGQAQHCADCAKLAHYCCLEGAFGPFVNDLFLGGNDEPTMAFRIFHPPLAHINATNTKMGRQYGLSSLPGPRIAAMAFYRLDFGGSQTETKVGE